MKVDGGAAKNNLLMQLAADITGKKVIRPKINETTALGAAYAAGLAQNFWNSLEELKKNWRVDTIFEPEIDEVKRNEMYKWWKKSVERAKNWLE